MAMLIVLLLNIDNNVMTVISYVLIYLSLALAIISAVDYIVKNKAVLKG